METKIYKNPVIAAKETALTVAKAVNENPGKLFCFAAGDTPMGMLGELVELQKAGKTDLNSVYYAGLDEWLGVGYKDKGSCAQVMWDNFYGSAGILPERINIFDGLTGDPLAEARQMDAWIKQHGGIFFTVLGIGLNGHIGFNEPNTPGSDSCSVVLLDNVTLEASKKYFDTPQTLSKGITINWKTLLEAKEMVMMAMGENKASIVEQSFKGPIDPGVPASLMQRHKNLVLVLDEAAAKE